MASPAKLSVADCDALLCRPGTIFETENTAIHGRNVRVWKHSPRTFQSFMTETMPKWSAKQFLSSPIADPEPYDAREILTYGETYDRAVRLAALLSEHGIGLGSRVAIGGTNCTGWVVSFIAAHLVGAVPVLINNGLQLEPQTHCLELTRPQLVLVDDALAKQLGPVSKELREKGIGPIWCWGPTKHLPSAAQAGVTEISHLPQPSKDRDVVKPVPGLEPESDGIIFFTSGTTSLPKGVLLTQRQALHIILSTYYPAARMALRMGASPKQATALATGPRPESVSLLSIPLFHAQGCLSWLVNGINVGTKLVFLRRWSVPDAVKRMVEEKVTKIGGVPAICTAVLQSPLLPKDFELQSSGFGGVSGPSRLPNDLVKRWPNHVPATGWGMTETSSLHTTIAGPDFLKKPTAAGQVIPIGEMRIVDLETRKDLPAGQPGLLLVRGSHIMKCYVNNPKATREAIDDEGWLDTGDMAFIDNDGDMYITDRAKDIIIRGGENVPSVEVERAVCEDDRIAEACAVPVPDDVLGERIGVCVSLAPGASATPLSVAQLAWPRLRYPARPDVVVVLDGPLPWNASQKILKSEVKKIVLAQWEKQGRKPMVDRTARL